MTGLVRTRAAAGNANHKTAPLNDTLHPNDAGYMVMAQTWYAAIRDDLR